MNNVTLPNHGLMDHDLVRINGVLCKVTVHSASSFSTTPYTFKDRVIRFLRKVLLQDRPDLMFLFMMLGMISAIPVEIFYMRDTATFMQLRILPFRRMLDHPSRICFQP
jgi:hypothetical protein